MLAVFPYIHSATFLLFINIIYANQWTFAAPDADWSKIKLTGLITSETYYT